MTSEHQTLALMLFSLFIAVTLGITTWVSRNRHGSAEEFYAGGRLFSPMENGFAIAGDYMSAASFLGISGLIALFGYDGLLYSVGFLVAWLVVLFLVAELVRNCGRFTLADVIAARMAERPVRIAAGASSVVVSVLYLVAQMVGAGSLVGLLLGDSGPAARTLTVTGVGALMVVYVTFGGMRATTWIQIVKAVLLMGGAIALTVLVLLRFQGNFDQLLTSAADRSGHGARFLSPGLKYGGDWTARLDFISLGLALVLGTAGLPHILSRFYTVPTARAAAVGIGAVAIALGLLAQDLNVAFLVGLAFAVAASANLPVLLYSLFWPGFTTRGAVWSVYGGLVPAVVLVALSPVVSGSPDSLLPFADVQYFPLQNPGLVSIPLGFLAGWLGTVTSREEADAAKHAETEVRSLTGAGAV